MLGDTLELLALEFALDEGREPRPEQVHRLAYNSAAYREVLPLRLEATDGFAMIVDGYVPAAA